MKRTPFAGLTELAPGEPLSTDGSSFTGRNMETVDQFLQRIVTHVHDGTGPLQDPTQPGTLVALASGGFLPPATKVYATYTLLDGRGGETAPAPIVTVTTPGSLGIPGTIFGQISYASGGSLQIGTYQYVFTVTDVSGGESRASIPVTLERMGGFASAEILIGGLASAVSSASGSSWRLYRSMNGGPFGLLSQGSTSTFIDDGTIPIGLGTTPPLSDTTRQTTAALFTVPGAAVAHASAGFNVYVSATSSFFDPSLFTHGFPTNTDTVFLIANMATQEGSPPPVSTAARGSNQIDEADILNLHWRDPVNAVGDLPNTGVEGDVRLVLQTGDFWGIPTGSAWAQLTGGSAAVQGDYEGKVIASHTGVIGVATGSSAVLYYLPPIIEAVRPGTAKSLSRLTYGIRPGASGSVLFNVLRNGMPIGAASGLTATSTESLLTLGTPTPVVGVDDFSALVAKVNYAANGSPPDGFYVNGVFDVEAIDT